MPAVSVKADLFDAPPLPRGLEYHEDFVSRADEAALCRAFAALPFREATFQQYTARRRVVRYGRRYDADAGAWIDGETLPPWLAEARPRVVRVGFVARMWRAHGRRTRCSGLRITGRSSSR